MIEQEHDGMWCDGDSEPITDWEMEYGEQP
jgi:hypothetical protein